MSAAQLDDLRNAHVTLLTQYQNYLEDVRALQRAVAEDVLPDVLDEAGLESNTLAPVDAEAFAREWLNDEASVFRILRRHRFTRSFALEHTRDTLMWRLRMQALLQPDDTPEDLCTILPSAMDHSGRLVTIVKASKLASLSCSDSSKKSLLRMAETLRLHTLYMNLACHPASDKPGRPVLQVAIILDMSNVAVYAFDVELLRWFTSDAHPRFPGLVGPIFVVNFSWTQGGMWTIVKRILPPSVLKRVMFVNMDQLSTFIPKESLPPEYGGTHTSTEHVADMNIAQTHTSDSATSQPESSISRVRSLLPHSLLNPFFGYPVTSAPGMTRYPSAPTLRHGRRRKRDLVRTLLILWWERWGVIFRRAGVMAFLASLSFVIATMRRRRLQL